jgi:hypothetical protein
MNRRLTMPINTGIFRLEHMTVNHGVPGSSPGGEPKNTERV